MPNKFIEGTRCQKMISIVGPFYPELLWKFVRIENQVTETKPHFPFGINNQILVFPGLGLEQQSPRQS